MRSPLPELHLIETIRTPDRVVEFNDGGWVTCRVKPHGDGWHILRDRERHTVWTRRKPVRSIRLKRRWLP